MAKLSVQDLNLQGKLVLVRVDFNVPLCGGKVADDTRIKAALPTLNYILDQGGRPILMSHLGRPGGKVVPQMSLKPVAKCLDELVEQSVLMIPDCVGEAVVSQVKGAPEGVVVLLENLRFHPGEEENSPEFAIKLAELSEVYVNDAFGTAHRAHASTEGITHYVVDCACGLLMEKELEYLNSMLSDPIFPFVAIIGGSKISNKIDVIANLLSKVNVLLIGGGMAYTFFKAMGLEIGQSILDEDRIDLAKGLMKQTLENGVKLMLPVDCIVASRATSGEKVRVVSRDSIPENFQALDIGPESRIRFSREILSSKTALWNGPMGVFEIEEFSQGTNDVAKALAKATLLGATTIAGGGETVSAVTKLGLVDGLSHLSTGGGASLEFLEGKMLPGVEALTQKE